MIASFADSQLDAFWRAGRCRRIPADLYPVLRRKLLMIHAAGTLDALRQPPGNRLEVLKGDKRGCHSIRVNDRWRLVFRWIDNAAHDLRFVDYH